MATLAHAVRVGRGNMKKGVISSSSAAAAAAAEGGEVDGSDGTLVVIVQDPAAVAAGDENGSQMEFRVSITQSEKEDDIFEVSVQERKEGKPTATETVSLRNTHWDSSIGALYALVGDSGSPDADVLQVERFDSYGFSLVDTHTHHHLTVLVLASASASANLC